MVETSSLHTASVFPGSNSASPPVLGRLSCKHNAAPRSSCFDLRPFQLQSVKELLLLTIFPSKTASPWLMFPTITAGTPAHVSAASMLALNAMKS